VPDAFIHVFAGINVLENFEEEAHITSDCQHRKMILVGSWDKFL
jgi:hypothetical protein